MISSKITYIDWKGSNALKSGGLRHAFTLKTQALVSGTTKYSYILIIPHRYILFLPETSACSPPPV